MSQPVDSNFIYLIHASLDIDQTLKYALSIREVDSPPKYAIIVIFDSQDVPPCKSKRLEAHHPTPRSITETPTLILLWVTTTQLLYNSYEKPLISRPLFSRHRNCRETTNISPSLTDMSAGLFKFGTENQRIWGSDWKDLAFEGNGEHREIRMFIS